MKNLCRLCFVALLLCLAAPSFAQSKITHLSDLTNKRIAVPKGTIADLLVASVLPKAEILYYNNAFDCVVAVKADLADCAAYDEPVLHALLRTNNDLRLLPELITHDEYCFAVQPARTDLTAAMNVCIDRFMETNAFQNMDQAWYNNGDFSGPATPEVTEYRGVLKFGTCSDVEPFAFKIESGDVVGFDIELAYSIAQELGLKLEVYDMAFHELIPALLNGKVDMIGAGLTFTHERAKQVLFSKPYYYGGIAALVKR